MCPDGAATCSCRLRASRVDQGARRDHQPADRALHTVFQATVVAKLTYASQAWWDFASAADKARIEAFLRRSVHFGYRADSAPTLASISAATDDKLFALVKSNFSSVQIFNVA